jgi:mannosyltransferase
LLPHALLVLHGWRRERERAMGWWLVCASVVVVTLVPLVYFAKGQSAQVEWITADDGAVRGYPGQLFGSDLVVLTMVGLALVGVLQLARRRAGNMFAVLVWAVFPPVFCYATFDLVHLFLAKYVLYTLPAWALLVGGVLGVPKTKPAPVLDPTSDVPPWAAPATRKVWLGRWAAAGAVLTLLAVAVVGLPAQRDLRRDPPVREPDFRGAAAVVDQGFQPGDAIVYAGTYRLARLPFMYELKSDPKDVFAAGFSGDNGWFHPQDCGDMAACLGKTPRVWLVLTNFTEDDDWLGLQESQKTLLDGPYKKASTVRLENIRVLLLERKS